MIVFLWNHVKTKMAMANNLEIINIGAQLLSKGQYHKAIEALKIYSNQHAEDIEVVTMLADAYAANKQHNMSADYYSKALSIDPIHTQNLIKLSALRLTGPNYIQVLANAHRCLKPKRYIEIGVCKGVSFSLADPDTIAIGIDPEPQIDTGALPEKHKVICDTSDNYFASGRIESDLDRNTFDMAFLDGMHLFEYALRDFMNLEKHSNSDSVIFIHDLYPMNAETSTRERNSDFWSGDVWKLVLCLSEYRPDLDVKVLPCPPTGLGVIKNLDSTSTVLEENYAAILEKFVTMSYDVINENKDEKLKLVSAEEIDQLYV